ncbi:MAG: DEDD exonuclease domain-containing protein [Beutenbergiaceae bacterium]
MRTNLLQGPPAARLPLEPAAGHPVQLALDELGLPLHEVTFVVVDLETTGGSPRTSEITEIGAVKVRGGQVLGEFATLINPGTAIPPTITVLTGITTAMVLDAPTIEQVLPAFLEFAHGSVLVAHNAGFDVGFLKAKATRMDLTWPAPMVVDTVKLARKVVTRDEAPNHKLSSLAALFKTGTRPNHRALSDARATVDVLHGLLGRMASLGVSHLEDLPTAADPVPPARRARVTLADELPTCPGVYMFLGPAQEVLYIGTATNLRRRVRQYFTASEKRRRIGEMVDLATSVRGIGCATRLQAQVHELRLIAQYDPPYNRRSKRPHRLPWLRLTEEPYPRLSIVREVPAGAVALGPFSSQQAAQDAMAAIHHAIKLRQCTRRLPATVRPGASDCIMGQIGQCLAPCINPQVATDYAAITAQAAYALTGRSDAVISTAAAKIGRFAAGHRFEQAAIHRDRALAFARVLTRSLRLSSLQRARQIIAARARTGPGRAGGWEILIIRYGRLTGTILADADEDPMDAVAALRATAEAVAAPSAPALAASTEETEMLCAWLGQPGTRLIEFDHPEQAGWSLPLTAAAPDLGALVAARQQSAPIGGMMAG